MSVEISRTLTLEKDDANNVDEKKQIDLKKRQIFFNLFLQFESTYIKDGVIKMCVCVCVCVFGRERDCEYLCVCTCVCKRECVSEREKREIFEIDFHKNLI